MIEKRKKAKRNSDTALGRYTGWNGFVHELRKNKIMFLMILPAIIYFLVFCYAPMFGTVLAFKRYNYADGILNSPWVGFDNFKFLYRSGTLWRVTRNTVLYNLAFLVLDAVLQVSLAVLLNEIAGKYFKKIAQSIMFLPYFVSAVLLASLVYNIFGYEHGTLNTILSSLGLEKFDAYNTPTAWIFILTFFHVWKGLGYGMVVYLAAITGINSEYYEAARVDGASKWKQIRYITLPMLKPTVVILTLFSIGKIMKGQFELFYQVVGSNGVLYKTTDIIDTYVFRMTTQSFDPGMATAAGLYQSVFGLILILTVNKIVKRIQPDYALF